MPHRVKALLPMERDVLVLVGLKVRYHSLVDCFSCSGYLSLLRRNDANRLKRLRSVVSIGRTISYIACPGRAGILSFTICPNVRLRGWARELPAVEYSEVANAEEHVADDRARWISRGRPNHRGVFSEFVCLAWGLGVGKNKSGSDSRRRAT